MKYYLIVITTLLIVISSIAHAERLSVAGSVANIRSGPGTTHGILWSVGKYYPFNVLKKSGAWYRLRDFEGDEGWIHKSLVRNIPSVITKNEKCNIRSGPGTQYKMLITVGKGIPFKIIKRKANWLNIQHADGDKGWIHASLVW
ncbi:SH3 domain-containing protein [Thermodesulfobacteriota bacterium]